MPNSDREASMCRRFEVPTSGAGGVFRNFKSKSGTRIIFLLVPLCFRSSCQRLPRCITNFGSGALGARECACGKIEKMYVGLLLRGFAQAKPSTASTFGSSLRPRHRSGRQEIDLADLRTAHDLDRVGEVVQLVE